MQIRAQKVFLSLHQESTFSRMVLNALLLVTAITMSCGLLITSKFYGAHSFHAV